MDQSHQKETSRLDMAIAFLIAVVSTTFALSAWRISMVSSSAGDANRQGIIDAVKKQASMNENWRQTYSEAGYAENYAVTLADIQALEASPDPAAQAQAADLRQYLLPNLKLLADPLVTDPAYQKPDGTYDLQKRFDALEAASPDLTNLDPQASFRLASRYYTEQRWLTVATVLLAISLFWLALAEIGGKRFRTVTLVIGAGVFAVSLTALAVIELLFVFLRGGVL
jgi:hypothetical protein